MDLEREKGITIKARAVRLEHTARDGLTYGLNLIDTPGHVDFSYEVSRSLQACEGAILVVDAAQGIEAQTLANVHLALAQGLVIIPVLNKIDLPSAQPEVVIEELENVLAIPREEVILVSAKDGTGVELSSRPSSSASRRPRATRRAAPGPHLRLPLRRLQGRRRLRPPGCRARSARATHPAHGLRAPRRRSSSWACSGRSWCPVKQLGPGEVGYVATGLKNVARLPGRRHASPPPRAPAPQPLPGLQARQEPRVRGHLPGHRPGLPAPARRAREAPPQRRLASPSSRRARSRSGSGSAAASWACSTWRSSRSASSASSTSTSSPRRPRSSTTCTLTNGRGDGRASTTRRGCPVRPTSRRSRSPGSRSASSRRRTYIGTLMELVDDPPRLVHGPWSTSTRSGCSCTFELPLAEVIVDFYDQLKSRTPGLRLDGLRGDRLPGGRPRQARRPGQRASRSTRSALIVHRDKAPTHRAAPGREAAQLIPRQMFEVPVQAAIGVERHRPRDDPRDAQERPCQVLRWRHHPQAQAAREAEGGQAAHEAGGQRGDPAGGLPRHAAQRASGWP